MGSIIVFIVGFLGAGAIGGALFFLGSKSGGGGSDQVKRLIEEKNKRLELKVKFDEVYGKLVSIQSLRERAVYLRQFEDSLKAERGRITITNAELETVETRLRELDEITHELSASGNETQQELAILQQKEAEINSQREQLRQKIELSNESLKKLMTDLKVSSEVETKIQEMQTQLISTETKIAQVAEDISSGNQQYFTMKKRYDALDIEFAQLYEKFSEAEALAQAQAAQKKG